LEGQDAWFKKQASGLSFRIEFAPDKVVLGESKGSSLIEAIIEEDEREDSDGQD